MIKNDLKKKQQQKESSQKQQTHMKSDRQRKGSRDSIKNRNRFGSVYNSSEFLDTPTPRSGNNRSRSPLLPTS